MAEPETIQWAENLDRIRARQPVFLQGEPDPPPAVRSVEGWRRGRWATIVPSRFVHAEIDDTTPPKVKGWADSPAGRNLVLVGTVGSGKTWLACAAARPRFMAGDDLAFMPIVELLDALRPGGPDNAMEEACGVDLLIIDDLGTEKPTEWTAERLYAVVNRRWMEERPTIVTSNLDPEELETAVGARMYSRLVGSDAVTVRLTGPDRRRTR